MTVKDPNLKVVGNSFLYNAAAAAGTVGIGLAVGGVAGGVIGYGLTGGSIAVAATGAGGGAVIGGYVHHQHNVNIENQEKIKGLEANLDTEEKNANTYKKKAEDLGSQLGAAKNAIPNLKNEHNQTIEELKESRAEVVRLSDLCAEMRTERDEGKAKIEDLTSKLDTTKAELDKLAGKYEAGEEERSQDKAKIDDLTSKLDTTNDEMQKMKKEWASKGEAIDFIMKQYALSNSQSPHMQVPNELIKANEVDSPDVAEAKTSSLAYQVPIATLKEQISRIKITAKVLNEQGVFSRGEGPFEQDHKVSQPAEQALQETGYEILPVQNL